MSQRTVIASDSTCDLSPELIREYGIRILPLGVALGEKQYTDGVDIDPDFIYAHYEKTGELPKTSAVNLADFEEFFARETAEGNAVVLFTISSEMSSTYNNARLAAESFANVHVVDTRNLSTGGGLLVITAAEMAAEGKPAAEIAETCRGLAPCVDASFIIDSLEFLYKGDDMAEDVLYFTYGIDDPSIIEDFAICQRADGRAASFAILRFAEGTDAEALKDTLQTYYVEAMYSLFQLYIPEEYDVALGATYKIYDNAIVLAVYDTNGNTAIFDVVDKYAE